MSPCICGPHSPSTIQLVTIPSFFPSPLQLRSFPALQEQTEKIVATKIQQQERKCKDQVARTHTAGANLRVGLHSLGCTCVFFFCCCVQVLLLLDVQLAYINTKHEDFIGLR